MALDCEGIWDLRGAAAYPLPYCLRRGAGYGQPGFELRGEVRSR